MTENDTPSPPALILPQAANSAPPPPPKPPEPPASPQAAPTQAKSGGIWLPALGVLAFLILAGGEAYLYLLHQATPPVAAAQIAGLQSQISALQSTVTAAIPAVNSQAAQAGLDQKFANLNAQVQAMQAAQATDHGTLTQLAANNVDLTKLATKIEFLSRLETARMALESGQPLGDIPNAPPSLAKYATMAPPTLSDLILSYPQAAKAANDASVSRADKAGGVLTGALARVESLVTISKGGKVLIGAPAAAITAKAGQELDAGNLAAAVATLTTGLSTATQQAMGDWLTRAQSLAAARSALIALGTQP
jgi:hypothetical protein